MVCSVVVIRKLLVRNSIAFSSSLPLLIIRRNHWIRVRLPRIITPNAILINRPCNVIPLIVVVPLHVQILQGRELSPPCGASVYVYIENEGEERGKNAEECEAEESFVYATDRNASLGVPVRAIADM